MSLIPIGIHVHVEDHTCLLTLVCVSVPREDHTWSFTLVGILIPDEEDCT